MKYYIIKVKHILPTIFIILFSSVVGISFFRWLFTIKFNIINYQDSTWEGHIPMIVVAITFYFWLWPKLRILTSRTKDEFNLRLFIVLISLVPTLAPNTQTQKYITSISGTSQKAGSILGLDNNIDTRYYILDSFFIVRNKDKYRIITSVNMRHYKTGRSISFNKRAYLDFDFYYLAPLTNYYETPIGMTSTYWYGFHYHDYIYNSATVEQKKKAIDAFYKKCVEKVDLFDYTEVKYFDANFKPEDIDNFKKIAYQTGIAPTNNFKVLEPHNIPFEKRNYKTLAWLFGMLCAGIVLILFVLIFPKVDYRELKRQQK